MECCSLCLVTPTVFSRGHIFQTMHGVIGFLTETVRRPSSLHQQPWGRPYRWERKQGMSGYQMCAYQNSEQREAGAGLNWAIKDDIDFQEYCKLFAKHSDRWTLKYIYLQSINLKYIKNKGNQYSKTHNFLIILLSCPWESREAGVWGPHLQAIPCSGCRLSALELDMLGILMPWKLSNATN